MSPTHTVMVMEEEGGWLLVVTAQRLTRRVASEAEVEPAAREMVGGSGAICIDWY